MRIETSRWSVLLVALLLSMAVGVPVAMANAEIETELAAAAAAYERGDHEAAALGYERAIELGADHPLVHYNLGNARFKGGELGPAIASYVRAQRRAPRDGRIITNLALARAQIRDRELSSREWPAAIRPFPWLYGLFSLNEWWALALAAYGIIAGLRIAAHWRRGSRILIRRAMIGFASIAVLAAVMGTIRYRSEVSMVSAVAITEEIEVRSGPGRDYNLAFRIHEGLEVVVKEDRGEWVRIDLGGELVGWVPATSLENL